MSTANSMTKRKITRRKRETCDPFGAYLDHINSYPLLQPEQEKEYARRIQESDDSAALEQLVNSHLRLVVKIAKGDTDGRQE